MTDVTSEVTVHHIHSSTQVNHFPISFQPEVLVIDDPFISV